jgi:membrane protease YdiL (CAAX protease family)
MHKPDPAVTALGLLSAYNLVQNLAVPERAYVPSNLVATAGLIAFARRSGLSYGEVGLGADRFRSGLALGAAVAAGVAGGFSALSRSGRFDHWLRDERARGHGPVGAAYQAMIRFPVGTALFEEVAFRGVLDGVWRNRRDERFARALTAAAFGVWHLVPTYRLYPGMGLGTGKRATRWERIGAAIGAAVFTGISGFGFSFLRDRSGSVAAPWLVHAAYNTGGYLVARRAWGRDQPLRSARTGAPRM